MHSRRCGWWWRGMNLIQRGNVALIVQWVATHTWARILDNELAELVGNARYNPAFPLTLIQRGSDAFICTNKQWITTDMSVLVFSRVRTIWVCSISSYRDMVEHTDLASRVHCWSSSFINQVYEWIWMTILNLIQIIGLRWQRKLMISDELRWEKSEQLSDTNLLIICIMRMFKCHFNSFPNVSF